MTLELEQEESIAVLNELKVLQKTPLIKVEDLGSEKIVHRTYQVELESYPMDNLIVEYKVNKCTDRVKDYLVKLQNSTGLEVYLCKYSPNIFNTLFNNIILLELSNWRRTAQGLKPLRTIKDYTSLMFELDINNKQMNNLLKKTYNKNTPAFTNKFQKFINTNYIVPTQVWAKQVLNNN